MVTTDVWRVNVCRHQTYCLPYQTWHTHWLLSRMIHYWTVNPRATRPIKGTKTWKLLTAWTKRLNFRNLQHQPQFFLDCRNRTGHDQPDPNWTSDGKYCIPPAKREKKKGLRNSPTHFREAGSLIVDNTLEDSPGTINRATAKEGNSLLNISIKKPHHTRRYYNKKLISMWDKFCLQVY